MINSDPLAFLDEIKESEASAETDPLSFLGEPSRSKQPSFNTKSQNTEYVARNGTEASDPLAFLDEPQKRFDKFDIKPYKKDQGLIDIYMPEEKTPEQLKTMSVRERMEYADELNRVRELQQGRGFTKGALSGLTLSASEHIPGLKPDQEDLMVGLGETVGSFLPISKLYNFIGKPIVNFASKSPVAKEGLMALARMTGFGVTGATYKAGKELVQGEVPSPTELVKEGARWAAIDGVLQSLGAGVAFGQAVRNIAETEGVTAKEVLGKLWNATKRKFKRPILPDEIGQPEVETLMEETVNAEKRGLPKEVEIEAEPKKPAVTEAVPEGKAPTVVPEAVKPPEKIDLTGMGKGITGNLYAGIYKALSEGKDTIAGAKDPLIAQAKPYFDKGLITSPEDLRKFANEGPQALEKLESKALEPVKTEEAIEAKPKSEGEWEYTYEDFSTKAEAKDYLDHLQRSLAKAPESHKATLERDITNLEDLIRGFEEKEKPAETGSIRQIVKDIHDLKKVLSGVKGQTREARFKRIALENQIRQKSGELKDLRKPLEDVPEKQIDVSPKKLKSQKDYFVDTLENAIEHPTDKEFVTVKVPDDGVFRFPNVEESLEEALRRVRKDWPVKQVTAKPPEHDYSSKIKGEKIEAEEVEPEEREVEPLASRTTSKKPTQTPPPKTRPRQPIMGKKQAVARSKILTLFRTAFTDPIRLGKFKQRAAGIHKLWPKVTRLLKDNDVETAAHEVGHNLHTTLYGGDAKNPSEQERNISAALRPYLDELKPLAHYEPWGMEGFAEFTRMYVTNPDVAKELAPKFYAKFEADLDAQYPEMKNALLEARDYYDQYLQGTPESRIRAQTSYADDKGKLASIIDFVKKYTNPDLLKTEFLDDVFPAKRLVAEAFGIPLSEVENLKDDRNLYRALRVLKGAVGKGDVFVLHETFNAKTLDKVNGSLRDILKQLPDKESYREFNDYLIARRALEKSAQNIETGINAGDALAVEQNLRPKYGSLAQELDKYNDSLLNYAKEAGLLSGEQYKMIKDNNVLYAPFARVMEPEKGGAASGAGKLQGGKPLKRMKGSTRDIIAPIESVLKNTYSIIINAEKNLAGQVLAKIAKMKNMGGYVEKVPTPIKLKGKIEGEQVSRELAKRFEREGLSDLIEYDQDGKPVLREDIADAIPEVFLRFGAGQYPAGENIVTVYFGGKPAYYEVSPEIFEMWTKGIAPYSVNLLTKILRIPARTLRAGAILNPKFVQKNAIRDTWGGWLFTKYGKSVNDPAGLFIDTIYSPLAMLSTAAKKGPLYVEWLKSGGGMSTMQSLDRDAIMKKLEEVRHGYKPHQVIKWLRQVAEISEEANRLAEFARALKVEGQTRLGKEIAAFAARDLSIDFAKMGLQTKALNQIIPFFNATIQGGDKLLRTLANPEDRKNFLPRIIGFIVIPSLMLAWLNKDDERVKEFYEEEKDFNFITFVGDKAIKIPVPFETGVMAHGLTQRMFNHFMKEDPEAFEQFMGSIMSAMLPNMIPTFANPAIEAWANKNFFTGARIIPPGKEGLISKYQYKNYTSSTARLLGRAMTYMLGEETRSMAASPAILDHFYNSWTGGLGKLILSISDASLEAAGLSDKIPGPQASITDKLGLDAFTARYPRASTRSIEKFYDNYANATSIRKSHKYAEKMELETEEGQREAYKRFDKVYDYQTLQNAYKAMQASQREINNIWNDPSLDPELKKQLIDDLYLQQIDFAKTANDDIRQYRLSQKE